jgi:hypothetical protein
METMRDENQQAPDQQASDQQQPKARPIETPDDRASVEQPGKLMRLAVMIRETLEEVRRAPLDTNAREYLADVHHRIIEELRSSLSGPLVEELDRIALPLNGDQVPSEAALRIAQAQLLGWLEGLFQGIQAAIASQQAAMVAQLEEMRRKSLPAGQQDDDAYEGAERGPGQYL